MDFEQTTEESNSCDFPLFSEFAFEDSLDLEEEVELENLPI